MSIQGQYQERFSTLKVIAEKLESHMRDHLNGHPRIDRISARPKAVESFINKAEKEEDGAKKYSDPLKQIQDQIGARVIVFYKQDVDVVSNIIEDYFRKIESVHIVPDSESEFGYFGKHYILLLPDDVIEDGMKSDEIPTFFELQIKTLFQHAWSEANHDLGYKSENELEPETKRKIAFTSAQAWGADLIFNELLSQLVSCNN